jgi:hypothetical protein
MSHRLTYDNLPSHSRLQRQYVDGVLKIIASPEEPGPLARRAAMFRAAVPAALICFCTLIVGIAIFGAAYDRSRRSMSTELSIALFIAFVIFCAALFALVWRIQYQLRIEAVESALQQTTVIAASRDRLIVETSGPFGAASHDWKLSPQAHMIEAIRLSGCDDQFGIGVLEVLPKDGAAIRILPGRDEIELKWVAGALRAALNPENLDQPLPKRTIP